MEEWEGVCDDALKMVKLSLRAGPRRTGNGGPSRKTVYVVLVAFAHERSILIGCLLLDIIIREF